MRALTYFNTLQKPVNIKASALLIIHIWSKLRFSPIVLNSGMAQYFINSRYNQLAEGPDKQYNVSVP